MISILCYVVGYYNIVTFLKNIYLPAVIKYIGNTPIYTISTDESLYFFLKITSYVSLIFYVFLLFHRILITHTNDKYCLGLILIYFKYIFEIIITPNQTLLEYEIVRSTMWVFTTPLMLSLYCEYNNLTLNDIKIIYHLCCLIPQVFLVPFKHFMIYKIYSVISCFPIYLFLKKLYNYKHLPFTLVFISTWLSYILINIIDITCIFNPNHIHAIYNLLDTLCKLLCNIHIYSYIEQEQLIRNEMDLQSVGFISLMLQHVKNYEKDNQRLSTVCKNLIADINRIFTIKIPKTNNRLKLDLLQKILPFGLDVDYVNQNTNIKYEIDPLITDISNNIIQEEALNKNKKFDFICILFIDIVNYTSLAKKYDGNIIFKLLNKIYTNFDKIIKKYSLLQKIETIGDAYMLIGDIYRTKYNHKEVIKQIVLLSFEFLREIKKIETPDNIPLCIRIGISIGDVQVGILGNEIPRLCVVGNAVNVAARLQSTAESDTIQISRHIHEQLIQIEFENINLKITENKNVFLKNIGSINTYSIHV